jgi:hypothetical protein
MTTGKAERIRDAVHNLITFGPDTFDQMLWRIIETPPFQRHTFRIGWSPCSGL